MFAVFRNVVASNTVPVFVLGTELLTSIDLEAAFLLLQHFVCLLGNILCTDRSCCSAHKSRSVLLLHETRCLQTCRIRFFISEEHRRMEISSDNDNDRHLNGFCTVWFSFFLSDLHLCRTCVSASRPACWQITSSHIPLSATVPSTQKLGMFMRT